MMREIEEVKEELGLNQSNAKDISEDQQIEQQSELKSANFDKLSKSHDLEQSKQSAEDPEILPAEEEKIETKKQEDEMMKELKEKAYLDRLSQRPQYKQPKQKRESKSEAAKIARYNLKLLESIYQAYDPEQADNVVRVFRKGGVFTVEPIMEEDFEESFDSTQQDLESQGGTEANTGLLITTTKGSGKEVNKYLKQNSLTTKNRKYGNKDMLGDIKEENSQLLDEMFDEEEGRGDKMAHGAQSEQTGFDFDDMEGNEIFNSLNDDPESFNALAAIAGTNHLVTKNTKSPNNGETGDTKGNKTKGQNDISDSYEYDDETIMGGATLNPRKKNRKRRIKKKKKDNTNNEKIRQLEQIYNSTPIVGGGSSVRVSNLSKLILSFKAYLLISLIGRQNSRI